MAEGARRMLTQELFADRPLGGWHGEMADGDHGAVVPAPGPPLVIEPPDWGNVDEHGRHRSVSAPVVHTPPAIPPPPWKAAPDFEPLPPLHLEPIEPFRPPPVDWEQELREQHEREHGPEPATLEEQPRRHPPPQRTPAA